MASEDSPPPAMSLELLKRFNSTKREGEYLFDQRPCQTGQADLIVLPHRSWSPKTCDFCAIYEDAERVRATSAEVLQRHAVVKKIVLEKGLVWADAPPGTLEWPPVSPDVERETAMNRVYAERPCQTGQTRSFSNPHKSLRVTGCDFCGLIDKLDRFDVAMGRLETRSKKIESLLKEKGIIWGTLPEDTTNTLIDTLLKALEAPASMPKEDNGEQNKAMTVQEATQDTGAPKNNPTKTRRKKHQKRRPKQDGKSQILLPQSGAGVEKTVKVRKRKRRPKKAAVTATQEAEHNGC